MDYSGYKAVIKNFLDAEDVNVLLLRGSWGAGKTFLWKDIVKCEIENPASRFDKYCYLSIFGADSISQVQERASHSRVVSLHRYLKKISDPSLNSFGTLFKAFSLEPEVASSLFFKMFRFFETLPVMRHVARLVYSWSFYSLQKYVVCIDDLERKDPCLSPESILGFVDLLSKVQKCKVILIMGEGGASEKLASSGLEKVVDVNINFSLGVDEYLKNIAVFELGQKELSIVRSCIKVLEIKNIRTVIRSIYLYKANYYLFPEFYQKEIFMSSILFWMWGRYECDELSEETVERAQYSFLDKNKNEEDQKLSDKILQVPAFYPGALVSKLCKFCVDNGYLDDNLLVEIYEKGADEERKSNPYIKKAFSVLNKGGADDLSLIRDNLLLGLQHPQTTSIRSLSGAVALLKDLQYEGDLISAIDLWISHNGNFIEHEVFRGAGTQDNFLFSAGDIDALVVDRVRNKCHELANSYEAIDLFKIYFEDFGQLSRYGATKLVDVAIDEIESFFTSCNDRRLGSLKEESERFVGVVQANFDRPKDAEILRAKLLMAWLGICNTPINKVRIGEGCYNELQSRKDWAIQVINSDHRTS